MTFDPRFAVQIAKANGATVIATTSSYEKAKILEKLGADYIINYKDKPDWDKEVESIVSIFQPSSFPRTERLIPFADERTRCRPHH